MVVQAHPYTAMCAIFCEKLKQFISHPQTVSTRIKQQKALEHPVLRYLVSF